MVYQKVIRPTEVNEELKPVYDHMGVEYLAPSLITGEKALVEINQNPNYPTLSVKQILEPSADRITPECPIYEKCGGCALLHMTYERQLREKTAHVKRVLKRYSHLNLEVPLCLGMKKPFGYRNKNQIVYQNHPREKIISGFYREGTHDVINFRRCLVQDELSDKIALTVKEIMISLHLPAYNEDYWQGFLRHVMVKRSFVTGQTMVVLITAKEAFPRQKDFLELLLSRHPEITTIVQNINNAKTSAVLGDRERVLFGSGYIIDVLSGKKFMVSSRSFYQVNPYQAEVLYRTALNMAKLTKNDVLMDAYSGVGTIGIIASDLVKRVISVEIVEDAVRDGIRNAKLNDVENIRFYHQDATKLMIDMARHDSKVDVVILDPPRRGSGDLFMSAVIALRVRKIIYISCNPVTQAQDIVKLLDNGYQVSGIQPVDLFPHTAHVENILLLERR